MRIDTARNQIVATTALLQQAMAQLEDLYVLAYERQAAHEERVAGGLPDYALDTHGDPYVRDAYRAFSDALTDMTQTLAQAAHDLLRHLARSPLAKTGPRTVSAAELALLLEAKARRAQQGEYQPVMHLPQPDRDDAIAATTQDKIRLERLTNRLYKALAEARNHMTRQQRKDQDRTSIPTVTLDELRREFEGPSKTSRDVA